MQILEKLVSIAAPHYCLGCGAEGSLLCNYCNYDLPSVPSRCFRCQIETKVFKVCPGCCRKTVLKHVWVRTLYQDLAQQLLHEYKFERAGSAHKTVARAMNDTLPHIPKDAVVVAVPTATARRRLRGYDHALLLAKEIANRNGLVYAQPLTRLTQSRQVGATRHKRRTQLEKAFLVTKKDQIKDKNILLVDDVVTTGATLEAVSRLLKENGAKKIDAVVFAQRI